MTKTNVVYVVTAGYYYDPYEYINEYFRTQEGADRGAKQIREEGQFEWVEISEEILKD
jgi:hypothetical protein